jgi:peptidoglycan/LPS O-acetylase OafA/YrhL
MPLSEHEQRILEEIERRLVAEDPKFAREVAAGGTHGAALRKVRRGAISFVAGFGLLVAGLFDPAHLLVLGIVAFTVMVAAAALVASGVKQVGRERVERARSGWLARMEDRWRRRYERGDGT